MSNETQIRLTLAALVFLMTNAVVFGAGLILVLMLPAFDGIRMIAIPVVVMASFVISAPLSWVIAPRLRLRYWTMKDAGERSRRRRTLAELHTDGPV